MADKTNIEITQKTWRDLNALKQYPNDTFNDVIQRLLTDGVTDKPQEPPTIEDALNDWPPKTKDNPDQWLADAQLVLNHLKRKNVAGKSDVISHLDDDRAITTWNAENWWENIVVPALKHAEKQGLVEYDTGLKKWKWLG